MNTKPNRHREYQKRVLEERGIDYKIYQSQIPLWWRNPTNPASLRLTHIGFKFFTKSLGIPFHQVEITSELKSKHLLQLERLFAEPYYLGNERKIIVFSESDAIMLQLHAGNLGGYLENLQLNSD